MRPTTRPTTRPSDHRDDGVEIDLPSRENYKVAAADSIAAERLKNGGPQLVDALDEVIQLAWTNETLSESWTKGVLCPEYK
jgi:hypothetical protein